MHLPSRYCLAASDLEAHGSHLGCDVTHQALEVELEEHLAWVELADVEAFDHPPNDSHEQATGFLAAEQYREWLHSVLAILADVCGHLDRSVTQFK